MRADEAPTPDSLPRDGPREVLGHEGQARDLPKEAPPVFTIDFAIRSSDVALPPKGLDLSPTGVEAARRKTEPSLSLDVTPGHARAVLRDGFVLAEGTELRMRSDRFGYVVVSPGGDSYRVGATGSLRAILGEGLFDVAPSSAAEVSVRGEGARRLGRATRRVEVTTRAAKATFEVARIPDMGDGGVLVCRMLLDLMSAGPATSVCVEGEVPLHVELRWSAQAPEAAGGHGRLASVTVFDSVSLVRRTDAALLPLVTAFLTPPSNAEFLPVGEPVRGAHLFLAQADLAAFRPGGAEMGGGRTPEMPPTVLSLHNSTDELRFVWLDGVPLAWLAPGGRLDVSGIPQAHASVQWRTFFGDAIDPVEGVTLPAMVDALPLPGVRASASDSPPP
jgi:hypothetical protein